MTRLAKATYVGVGREDLLGDADLHGVQRPRADAAEQEAARNWVSQPTVCLDVAVGAVEGQRADWRCTRRPMRAIE